MTLIKSGSDVIRRAYLYGQLLLHRHGLAWPLLIGSALLVLTLAGIVLPWMRAELAHKQASLQRYQTRPSAVTSQSAAASQDTPTLAAVLTAQSQRELILAKLFSMAEAHNLYNGRVEYRHSALARTAQRIEITMSVQGEYAQLQGYIEQTLLNLPSVSLDSMSIQREQAQDDGVDATLRFSLWLQPSAQEQEMAGAP